MPLPVLAWRAVVAMTLASLASAALSGDARASAERAAGLWQFVECAGEDDVSGCLLRRTNRALRAVAEIAESTGTSKTASDDSDAVEVSPGQTSVAKLVGQFIGEALSRLLEEGEEEEEEEEVQVEESEDQVASDDKPENKSGLKGESRKKKKKKLLMKIHNLIQKLFMLKMLIKSKFAMILLKLSFMVQLKVALIALLNLLVNLYRLYLQKTHPPEPQKVVYYEHAQHQHHYDQEHFHHDEDKGWLGNLWSRSVEEPAGHDEAYSAYRPVRAEGPGVRQASRQPHLTPRPLLG
ncbi:uncharacterized protein LOC134530422 [Bacillus rossius redtenbacheri]|uniref:uncharacterized protein LOC134530422 n=1 Tax=Bacillus rossius redtenbacheri TaxID=93214 RepID=UPI002FDEFEA1